MGWTEAPCPTKRASANEVDARTCQTAVPRPHFHATGSNAAQPKSWRLVCRSLSSRTNILRYLRAPRAVSSVGSEHLVYTEGVGGSSPSPPTQNKAQKPLRCGGFLLPKHAPSLLVGEEGQEKADSPEGRGFVLVLGMPLHWVHRPSHAREVVLVLPKHEPSLIEGGAFSSFGATPQCFQEHHEGRHQPQTNCHPPRSRLLSLHSPRRLAAPPMVNP